MTHDELVRRGVYWLKNNQVSVRRCPIILPEYKCYASSSPDVLGMSHTQTTVIECKVSRADYMADWSKGHRHHIVQLGNYRYYLVPPDLVQIDEIWAGWGLLYCYPHKITIEKEAEYINPEYTRAQEYQVMYSIIRRLTYKDSHDKVLSLLRGEYFEEVKYERN